MRPVLHAIRYTLIASFLFIAACASTPKPTSIKISLHAQPNVNPDLHGRASPVVVKFLELKSVAAFEAADFFSISDAEQKVFGSEMVNSELFQLRPGETLQLDRPLQPETRYIAVVAAFRDLEHSQWRASVAVSPKEKPSRVLIEMDATQVRISTRKNCLLWCNRSSPAFGDVRHFSSTHAFSALPARQGRANGWALA